MCCDQYLDEVRGSWLKEAARLFLEASSPSPNCYQEMASCGEGKWYLYSQMWRDCIVPLE